MAYNSFEKDEPHILYSYCCQHPNNILIIQYIFVSYEENTQGLLNTK